MRLYITSMSALIQILIHFFFIYSLILIFKKLPPPNEIIEFYLFDIILIIISCSNSLK